METEVKKPKVMIQVEKGFLEKVDEHWKRLNFKTRTEYIMFLVRNDINENRRVVGD